MANSWTRAPPCTIGRRNEKLACHPLSPYFLCNEGRQVAKRRMREGIKDGFFLRRTGQTLTHTVNIEQRIATKWIRKATRGHQSRSHCCEHLIGFPYGRGPSITVKSLPSIHCVVSTYSCCASILGPSYTQKSAALPLKDRHYVRGSRIDVLGSRICPSTIIERVPELARLR